MKINQDFSPYWAGFFSERPGYGFSTTFATGKV